MISEKFRRQLRQEARLWKAEGLVNDELYQQLADRYQFNSLETAASNRFVMILMVGGGILLGLGVITFVAANWQQWPRYMRVLLLLSVLIGFNTGGFYLWQHPTSESKQRLGQGLLMAGALSLGANIALLAQMFHIGGSPYGLYVVWGLGVLIMAYSLKLRSLSVLAIILLGLGYFQGINIALSARDLSAIDILLQYMPIASAILFIPLAYWCQSRVVFIMALLAIAIPLLVIMGRLISFQPISGIEVVISLILIPTWLWSYRDSQWPYVHGQPFQAIAHRLAILYLGFLCFLFSFFQVWKNLDFWTYRSNPENPNVMLINILAFVVISLWQWFQIIKPHGSQRYWGVDAYTTAISALIIITGIVTFWHISIAEIPTTATLIFNVQMFLLGAFTVRLGLLKGNRSAFWYGMVLLVLQIISRMFEYETELLLKALVLVLCGIAVIIAGLWFEKNLSRPTLPNSKS
ncbi:MAG: DUF2157 domain-containing protein [Limnospira sp. PMC 1291.21]|uniref:DUF2157 domain-containing protein n=1 Tax=Limnospira indica PCC 8005 TaxID=376219 RepID=A0A9P1KDE0_9CYAN|nr:MULTISPECIES: DUF2157 domain-containing protein [Limnospira]EKD05774.1 hypothetical protein SPLC1_S600320 [Arthrospira platensis C1]MDC0838367.1 DUF2157 domain-containing protein [Limnoraphis robusta]MDY7054009.1 DUF2157 domain-containing protein [Limnospira fusiformis LS22]QJB27156.1 DUF2157 domain-containing protein [Limnospira fusiformis SAG 85.79]MDT9178394.1 DUF2157 domain-containing protein [Limnospira sp. PMC 1238.20]